MKYFSPSYWLKMWVLSAPLFNDKTQGINAKSIDNNQKIKDWASNNTTDISILKHQETPFSNETANLINASVNNLNKKRVKRWTKTWFEIQNEWKNAEQAYQNAAFRFQQTQNQVEFSQAQHNYYQALANYNNSSIQWQQELQNWVNETKNERNQQWWIQKNTPQKLEAEKDWIATKIKDLTEKVDRQTREINDIKNKINQIENSKNAPICSSTLGGTAGVLGVLSFFFPPLALPASFVAIPAAICGGLGH